MLKQCLQNIGEGLLHACISSMYLKIGLYSAINHSNEILPFSGATIATKQTMQIFNNLYYL
jgi:hypothetical protein